MNPKSVKQILRGSVLATAAVIATVPFNIGGCADTMSTIGSGVGLATGGSVGGASSEMRYVEAGVKAVRAETLSARDEQEMGKSVVIALTNQYALVEDPKLSAYVTNVGRTVASVAPRPELEYNFGVLDTTEIGAYSGPGGYILITRGAINQMQDESELAGALAHEIAHVTRSHGLNAVKNAGRMDALLTAATADEEAQHFAALADGLGDVVIKNGYSKPQENDADAEAVKYLQAAGYDPRGYVRFLQRIERLKGSHAGGGLMSTHPGIAERAAKVSSLITTSGGATLQQRFQQNVTK